MDFQNKIQEHRDKLKEQSEKQEHKREVNAQVKATVGGAKHVADTVKEEARKSRQTTQPVKNVDPIASPEDIKKVADGLDELLVSQTITADDLTEKFKDISAGLLVLADEISSLPKDKIEFPEFPEQKEEIKVTNFAELSEYFLDVVAAVNNLKQDIKFDPTIEVAPADVKVEATDMKPVINGLAKLEKAIAKIQIPEYDNTTLLEATENVSRAINGLEFPIPNYVLPFKNIDGAATQMQIGTSGTLATAYGDTPSIDAFARLRVSNPETIFDSKQIFDNAPQFWDDQEVSGSGTSSTHSTATASTVMGVSNATAGKRVRQTFMRFNYQPGKSQLVLLTGTLTTASESGIKRATGIFDDNNGIFMQDNEGTLQAVIRSSTSGSAVDTAVTQANWNLDKLDGTGPSGVTLDPTKSQIIIIDYEWLGVGRVRIGFVVDGIPIYAHQFLNANNLAGVYMSTPNLPLRYEIENDGTGGAATLEHICASVVSEGGIQGNGILRHKDSGSISTLSTGTVYAVLGIRLQSAKVSASVLLENISLLMASVNDVAHWELRLNPTVAGTFTYSNVTNSAVQTATGASTNTVTGGTEIDGGFFSTALPSSATTPNALLLGSTIAGVSDEIVLCVRPVTNNITIESSLTWRELS